MNSHNQDFDFLGDSLISEISETQLFETINPSLKWPQLLQHPKFKGSYIQITSKSIDNSEITYKAIVSDISETIENELALILTKVSVIENSQVTDYIPDLTVSYENIISVTLIDSDPQASQTSMTHQPNSQTINDLSPGSSEISIVLNDNQSNDTPTFHTSNSNRINASLPFLSNGKVDAFYLDQLYKLENPNLTFSQWTQSNGIESLMNSYGYVYDIPLNYKFDFNNDQHSAFVPSTETELLSIRNHWETSFHTHRLPFDIWFPLEGYKFCLSFKTENPEINPNINSKGNETLNLKMETSNSDFSFMTPEIVNDLLNKPLKLNDENFDETLRNIYQGYLINSAWSTQNNSDWLIESINLTKDDFLLNGKYAWLYLPSYLYIPSLFLQQTGLLMLNDTASQITWLKLNYLIGQANEFIENQTDENFIIETTEYFTPWHVFTSKHFKALNNTNLIDHIQHFSAWNYFKSNRSLKMFSKKDIYDLFIRPIERIFSIDSTLSQKLLDSLNDMTDRNNLFENVMEITGLFNYKDDYFDANYLLHKLSKIRHLSNFDLSNKKKTKTGPVTLIFPFSVFEPSANDVAFNQTVNCQVHKFLEHRIKLARKYNEVSALKRQPFPLSADFLDDLSQFGGRNINLTNQLTISQIFNDLLNRTDTPSPLFSSPHSSSPPIPLPRTHPRKLTSFTPSPPPSPSLLQPQPVPDNWYEMDMQQMNETSFSIDLAEKSVTKTSQLALTESNLREHDVRVSSSAHARDWNEQHEQPPATPQGVHGNAACGSSPSSAPAPADTAPDKQQLAPRATSTPTPKDDTANFSFSTWQSNLSSLLTNISNISSSFNMYKIKQPSSSSIKEVDHPSRVPYSQALASRKLNSVPQVAAAAAAASASSTQPLGNTNSKPQRRPTTSSLPPILKPQYTQVPPLQQQQQHQKVEEQFSPNWSDQIDYSYQEPPRQPERQPDEQYSMEGMWQQQQRYKTPTRIIPSAQIEQQQFQAQQQQQRRRYRTPPPSIIPTLPSTTRPVSAPAPPNSVPKGKTNSTIFPWSVSKRITDREIQNRLTHEIPADELAKSLSFPCPKEPYQSLFWTSTNQMDRIPTWTKLPHSAHSIALVTDPDPVTPQTDGRRFYTSVDLCIFPMDDSVLYRDITFTSIKKGLNWYLQIKEDLQFPDGSTDDSFIFIDWQNTGKFITRLEAILHTLLPPAKDMTNISENGTYATKAIIDTVSKVSYYIDITHQSSDKGWLRFVHISQESLRPDLDMYGDVSFPWHLLSDFILRLKQFRESK